MPINPFLNLLDKMVVPSSVLQHFIAPSAIVLTII